MLPYTIKYQPKNSQEIIGQDEAVKTLKDFITNYKTQKKKAILLYGPSGTGKTSSTYAVAKELNLELIEINASDTRNKEQIENKVGGASKQMSLFSKGKIILIDEVDGLSGMKDRGGIPTIIKLIQTSTFPFVLTTTNPWDRKLSSLRKKTEMVKYDSLTPQSLVTLLKDIAEKEKLDIKESSLKMLARMSAGDARAAITDLETASYETDNLAELGERLKEESIKTALTKIFKTTDPNIAIAAFDNVKEDLNDQLLWLDENLPSEYDKPEDLARAYDKLSKADIFNRRIRRWQHWRFLIYINALITAGIAVSKDQKYKKFVDYKPTGRILKLWWAKQKSMKKKAIAQKIADHTHTSTRNILPQIDLYRSIFRNNKEMSNNITKQLDLTKEEIQWLKK
ncbi:MAG: replication factor C large subunit [Candidatus Woesearchaeota archaeon]|nr:replication factor C large subunit [Candidatus Woesearchaeota archaeon]